MTKSLVLNSHHICSERLPTINKKQLTSFTLYYLQIHWNKRYVAIWTKYVCVLWSHLENLLGPSPSSSSKSILRNNRKNTSFFVCFFSQTHIISTVITTGRGTDTTDSDRSMCLSVDAFISAWPRRHQRWAVSALPLCSDHSIKTETSCLQQVLFSHRPE